MKTRVLVLHPDPRVLQQATQILESEGLEVEGARSLPPNPGGVATSGPDAVLLGGAPDGGEDGNWRRIRALFPEAALLLLAPAAETENLLERFGGEVDDLVPEPFERCRLVVSLRNALRRRRLERRVAALVRGYERSAGLDGLVARSDAMRRTVELLRRAAVSDTPLLLHGVAGCDPELVARAVHAEGPRAGEAWIGLECAALPQERVGGELFGRGSKQPGALQQASRGTLYLGHVECLPRDAQGALLRELEQHRARLVASTHLELEALRGKLEGPLHAALTAQSVHLPSLGERVGDLPGLAWTALRRLAHRHGREIEGLTPAAVEALEAHTWPGDVCELEKVLERALLIEISPRLSIESLPPEFRQQAQPSAFGGRSLVHPNDGVTDSAAHLNGNGSGVPLLSAGTVLPFQELERRILLHALRTTGWNVQEAARRLKLGRATIYRKIDRYGLKREAS